MARGRELALHRRSWAVHEAWWQVTGSLPYAGLLSLLGLQRGPGVLHGRCSLEVLSAHEHLSVRMGWLAVDDASACFSQGHSDYSMPYEGFAPSLHFWMDMVPPCVDLLVLCKAWPAWWPPAQTQP